VLGFSFENSESGFTFFKLNLECESSQLSYGQGGMLARYCVCVPQASSLLCPMSKGPAFTCPSVTDYYYSTVRVALPASVYIEIPTVPFWYFDAIRCALLHCTLYNAPSTLVTS
jgi:hypothetical protein